MTLRTPVPNAAFEIRFSTTDSELEIFEIQPDNNDQDRNVPDPFKKRDKIPRSSGSLEQFIISNNNSSNNNSSNSNNGIPAPVRHSSLDSQAPSLMLKSRHHLNDGLNGPSKKGMSTNSDQISSLKVKSSNAVGPEADKQQRVNNNGGRQNSLANVNDVNTSDDDSISYKKRRPAKIDEIASGKEKVNSGKVIPNHQITDLNGKPESVITNNKTIMPKNTPKNKKTNMFTNNYKDDENKSLATPPDTPPPRSPYISSMSPLSDSDVINQLELEESQLMTPPSSSSARSSGESISQQIPRSSKKRRGSQSSQLSNDSQPVAKLPTPRSRRFSSAERPKSTVEEPLTIQLPSGRRLSSAERPKSITEGSLTSYLPNRSQTQPIPIRSRIPRLSISSKERPDISKKVSQGSLSLSSQDSNRFDDSKETLSSSYPVTFKFQSPNGLRSATSRPIINTSYVTDVEVESESPTSYNSYSPTSNSPPNHSPSSQMSHSLPKRSQLSHPPPNRSSTSPPVYQKKLTISHDDMIVPTVAKKLKMNGQLHFVNHDALLGYSEEPEDISPTTENGYMDITDQVVDLFDGSGGKSHKSHHPVHGGSQRRLQQSVRKNSSTGHSRNSSKTHYVAPRKNNYKPLSQQTFEDSSSPTKNQFENSSNRPTFVDDDFNKRRKSRREEYIMVIRDDDDDMELIEPNSSMPSDPSLPSVPSEPITAIVQVETYDQYQGEKIEEPISVQMPVVQETLNPAEIISVPTATSDKTKKSKKKQKKNKKGNDNSDDDVYARRSICRCM